VAWSTSGQSRSIGGEVETKITEIADGIYRLSTHTLEIAPPAGFTFNQFLIVGDEPLMFHTGLRRMFPLNRDALSRILPPERLRWIAFGHFEADECGAMNEWLAAAPNATPTHGQIGCLVSLADFADRAPRALSDGETIDIGAEARSICRYAPYAAWLGRRRALRGVDRNAALR
jgi:flavorubredoxin